MRDGRIDWLLITAVYATVMENPGCRQTDIARALGVRRCNVYGYLATMQRIGFLMWEDGNGRLYPFRVSCTRNATSI